MNVSTPGAGHNQPPREWIEVLRALLRKLRGVWADILRRVIRYFETEALFRRVDADLIADLRRVEQHPMLNEEELRALARAAGEILTAGKRL